MQKNSIKSIAVSIATVAAMTACAPMIGDRAGDVPPKLVADAKDPKQLRWDNPSSFGPVPTNLVQKGAEICGSLNTKDTKFKAIGYHPKAQAANGTAFPAGGYFCVAE